MAMISLISVNVEQKNLFIRKDSIVISKKFGWFFDFLNKSTQFWQNCKMTMVSLLTNDDFGILISVGYP